MEIKVNQYNTPIEELELDKQPKEVQEQFFEFLSGVLYIQALIKPDRSRAKDLPRDEMGRIIVDITKPHILENMDYFRKTGLHYQNTGKFTDLRPNPNPKSEYGKWLSEEVRRCHEGMVRPSDGEWIPGDLYFFWNYNLISLVKNDKKSGKIGRKTKGQRVLGLPEVWEGHYYKFHCLHQAREAGMHYVELASRQKGKTICAASLLAKRFILGESFEVNRRVNCYVTAQEKKFIVNNADQTLDKFQFIIDNLARDTEWPRNRLTSSLQNMQWTMGYEDTETKVRKGTLNSVTGITAKDDESKLRGTRGVLYIIEEAGSFPRLISLWNNMLPSVQDGNQVYGQIVAYGTAGDDQSDFHAMAEMMYHPTGYDIFRNPNVYDIEGKGGRDFCYFFPGYLNYSGFYDKDGNSDVTKSILDILIKRYEKKKNSSDINTVIRLTAEIPIVPQEAIIRTRGNFFPVALIRERINQLESNPNEYNDVLSGKLVMSPDGKVSFKPTEEEPIRQFPLKNNNAKGSLEIFKLPEKNAQGQVYANRYVIGHDPVNQDAADTLSLSATFVIDMYTESIAAEWTGRFDLQDESFEQVRLLTMFYNAEMLYECNNKMCYSYFSKMSCTYLLMDTPEYLLEKDIVKKQGYGNSSKGVSATSILNKHEDELLKEWLLMPKTVIEKKQDDEEIETTIPNVMTIRNLALLKELSQYNPQYGNYDRIRALGVAMIARNSMVIKYNGDIQSSEEQDEYDIYSDPFFIRNGLVSK